MVQGGVTALLIATWKGHTAVVRLLLIHGAKTDIQDNVCKWCTCTVRSMIVECSYWRPILLICIKNVSILQQLHDRILLLIAMCHQNLQKGYHPLYVASGSGNLECVELLLNHNAQIDLPTNVSYHCNMYYQCSLAMLMTVSLMYICIPLIFMSVTHAG